MGWTGPAVTPSHGIGLLLLAVIAALGVEAAHRRGLLLRAGDRPAHVPLGTPGAATAVLLVLVLGRLPVTSAADLLLAAVHAVVLAGGVLACATDVAVRRLPDVLTLPLAAVTTAALAALALMGPSPLATDAARGLLTTLLVAAVATTLALGTASLGLGDVKLLLPLTALLGRYGWSDLALGLGLAALSAGAVATVLVLTGRARARSPIPLGPFLLLGTTLAILRATAGPL